MKVYLILFPLLFCSCNKMENGEQNKSEKTEDQCFILNKGINYDEVKKANPLPTSAEILKNIPVK